MHFNGLVPELSVSSLAVSLRFYVGVLGFRIEYDRPEDKFAFLSREGCQLMLEERNGHWATGTLERPFGRGINFQIEVTSTALLLEGLAAAHWPLFREEETRFYRLAEGERSQRQFLVLDPDGYLLRFCQEIGQA